MGRTIGLILAEGCADLVPLDTGGRCGGASPDERSAASSLLRSSHFAAVLAAPPPCKFCATPQKGLSAHPAPPPAGVVEETVGGHGGNADRPLLIRARGIDHTNQGFFEKSFPHPMLAEGKLWDRNSTYTRDISVHPDSQICQ